MKDAAARLGLHLETGTGASLPRTPDQFDHSVQLLRDAVRRASAMGSPIVRTLVATDRAHLPPGPPAQHIETMIKLLRAVRSEAMDAGLKFAIENHKDLLCWETRQLIEGAGKEFVGSYLDTGNPVFVMEDPLETVETLGPLAVTLHLRDSVVYETRGVSPCSGCRWARAWWISNGSSSGPGSCAHLSMSTSSRSPGGLRR